jgi:flagellar basal-body rod protein FlgB
MRGKARNDNNDSSLRLDGNNVDVEREVMSIAETEHRFNALTEMTSRYFSGLKSVIREGR